MTTTQVRTGASLEELQAAMAAIQRGEFAVGRGAIPTAVRAAVRSSPAADGPPTSAGAARWQPAGRVVAVLAAHSGAGASTVAVAVAEALREGSPGVRLVELADASRSGLAAATSAELGEDGAGWRRGRRGSIVIDRLAARVTSVDEVPQPAPAAHDGEVLVIDIGWPARDALAAQGWIATVFAAASLLVVCRPTVPGIRQAEYLLADLAPHTPAPVTLAALGPASWPGAAAASGGVRVRAARESGRVVTVPLDRHVEVDGVSGEALPKALTAAGRALVAALPSTTLGDNAAHQPASAGLAGSGKGSA